MSNVAPTFTQMDSWLTRLDREVDVLRINEYVFWEVQRIIRQNKKLRVPSEFYEWLGRMYMGGMSVAIRRQVEEGSTSQSFVRFLNRLKGNPTHVSRQHYRSLYAANQRNLADRTYDRFVGTGRQFPHPSHIERQIQTLQRRSAALVDFANHEAAHMDQNPPTMLPKFREPGHVIRYLEKLLQHYFQLFRATHLDLAIHFQYDWLAPFRTVWLPTPPVAANFVLGPRPQKARRGRGVPANSR